MNHSINFVFLNLWIFFRYTIDNIAVLLIIVNSLRTRFPLFAVPQRQRDNAEPNKFFVGYGHMKQNSWQSQAMCGSQYICAMVHPKSAGCTKSLK